MLTLYTLGEKKQLYFAMYLCALLKKKITATIETYKKFALRFARYNIASTLIVCFLRHCVLPGPSNLVLGLQLVHEGCSTACVLTLTSNCIPEHDYYIQTQPEIVAYADW